RRRMSALAELVARSRRLGADRSVANWGGGNTSVKARERDHVDREIEVLWVKGSGSDLATIREEDFTGLRLADIAPILPLAHMSDEEMVAHLPRCQLEPGSPAAPTWTPPRPS